MKYRFGNIREKKQCGIICIEKEDVSKKVISATQNRLFISKENKG